MATATATATATKPVFRQDLLAEAIDEGDARYVDVMDDSSGVVFRFYESEYSLACGMDGHRDIAGLINWAEEELGLRPKATEVRQFIAKLAELGYLETEARAAAAIPKAAEDVITAPMATTPEDPHEVITTPIDKIDGDELQTAPVASPGSAGARSAAQGGAESITKLTVEATPAMPSVAKIPLASVPAAKAIVPNKRAIAPPVAQPLPDDETTTIASDEDLAPGVIASRPLAASALPVENVELGHVDRSAPVSTAIEPTGLDLELGQPGTIEKPAPEPVAAKSDDMQLGVAGATPARAGEVSTALAEHVPLDVNEVRDAVRASQVMKAVDPAEIEALAAAEPKAEAAKAEAAKAEAAKAEAALIAKPKTDRVKTAEPVRATPAPESGRATSASDDVPRPSRAKWLLGVAALAASAALLYKFVIAKDDGPARNVAAEKAAADKAAADQAAADKAAADKLAADKLAADQAAAEKKAAADKLAAEQAAGSGSAGSGSGDTGSAGSGSAGDQAVADKAAADQAAADKAAADKAAADKATADKAAADKAAADKAAMDKMSAAEKLAAEKAAAKQAALDAAAAKKAAAEQAAADRAAAKKAAADKAAADRAAAKQAAADAAAARKQAAADKAAAEKLAAKMAAEKALADKAAADKAAGGTDPAIEAAKKAARAKARAAAAAREETELKKLLEKQRKALEERKKAQGGGDTPPPAPSP